MTAGRSFDDPSRQAPGARERKDVVASAAGEQRYGAPVGTEIGQARDERERQAQGDPRARKLMEDVDPSVGAAELTKRMTQLNDADLQGLTKLAYSFKGTSPEIVAVRVALANALAKRGMDARQFGARGGGKGPATPPGKGKGKGSTRRKGDDNGDGTIDEDESGWDPATMGNRRGYRRDGSYVDNSKPEVVRKVRGEAKGMDVGDGLTLFGETKAASARTRTDGKASNDPSSTSKFPGGDWHPAPKGMTCSRHQHGDNPPPAVAYRVVNGAKLGACRTHKQEMTESKGVIVPAGEPLGAGFADAEAWDEGSLLGLLGMLGGREVKLTGFKPGQSQPSMKPGAAKLREYWVHGEGAAKIKWGPPGDFKRCVSHLRKYVGVRAEGLCNVYHRAATGAAPGQKGILLDAGPQVEFKTLYVESDEVGAAMRVVRLLDAPEVKGGNRLDHDELELADVALDELDSLDWADRDALAPATTSLDDDRVMLDEGHDARQTKSRYNDEDVFWHSYGAPGAAPWQRHAAATGDTYGAGMMLGLAGLRADAPVVREAKSAGVALVDVVDVIERKDVSTATGGTQQSWGFGSTEREGDPVAAASTRASGPRRLRQHFTRSPEGLQEWRPSQPGRFRRLTKALRKHVGAGAEGVAAIYYRQVMGHWPGTAGRGPAAAGVKSIGVHWDALARPDLMVIERKGTPPPPPPKRGKATKRPVPPPPPEDDEELTPEEVAAAQAEPDDDPDVEAEPVEDGDEAAPMGSRIPELDDEEPAGDEEEADPQDPDAEPVEDGDEEMPPPVDPDDGAPRTEGDEAMVAEDLDATEPEIDPETGEPVEDDQPSLDAAVAGEDGSVSPALAALFPELDEGGANPEGEFEDALLDDPDYVINPDGSLQMVDDDGNPVDEESADDELGRPDLDAEPGDQTAGEPPIEEDGEEDADPLDEEDGEEFEEDDDPDAVDDEDDGYDDQEQDGDDEDDLPGDADNGVNPAFGRPATPSVGKVAADPTSTPTNPPKRGGAPQPGEPQAPARPGAPARRAAPGGNVGAPPASSSGAKATRQAARGDDPGPASNGPVDGSKPGPVDKPGKAAKPGAKVNAPPFGKGSPPRRKQSGPSRATKAILS